MGMNHSTRNLVEILRRDKESLRMEVARLESELDQELVYDKKAIEEEIYRSNIQLMFVEDNLASLAYRTEMRKLDRKKEERKFL